MNDPNDPRLAAARRIKRGLLAELDRAAGIDTRLQRPLVDALPALLASLASRHDLPMRVVADLLDEVVPMLELLASVRAVVDRSVADRTCMAAIDGWAEVRDLLYPDTEVARQLNERRRMTPEQHAAERAAADAAEDAAGAGVHPCEVSPEASSDAPARPWAGALDLPEGPPTCPKCGGETRALMMHSPGAPSTRVGDVCLQCSPLGKAFAAWRRDPGSLD